MVIVCVCVCVCVCDGLCVPQMSWSYSKHWEMERKEEELRRMGLQDNPSCSTTPLGTHTPRCTNTHTHTTTYANIHRDLTRSLKIERDGYKRPECGF